MPKTIDNKQIYSYDEIHQIISKIANSIVSDNNGVDLIIAIASGGWIPARLIKNYFNVPVYSIGIQNYDENNKMLKKPIITQSLHNSLKNNKNLFENKKILLIDEIADSGHTFIKAIEEISSYSPKNIISAVLHKKEKSEFSPNYYGEIKKEEWIVYPWELKKL